MKLRLISGLFCHPKGFKFLTAGMLNTIFGYAIYALLLYVGISYQIALILATIAGIIFNYFSFGYIVFNGGRGWLIFCKFAISYLFIYGLNALGLSVLIKYFFVNPYFGQVICILPGILLSWLLMNCWVFKRL